ncbi:MAG: hypothetical protein ACM3YE_08205 [Bacteroidota bacterium]
MESFKDGAAVYWSVFIEYETVLEEPGRMIWGVDSVMRRTGRLKEAFLSFG